MIGNLDFAGLGVSHAIQKDIIDFYTPLGGFDGDKDYSALCGSLAISGRDLANGTGRWSGLIQQRGFLGAL